ncbi:MAG: GNAT family N-acetyltransferase [Pseudomonadota bacterium]|nr:GNAT family N-acetyltransferase [Pseudomonadota bacterium]
MAGQAVDDLDLVARRREAIPKGATRARAVLLSPGELLAFASEWRDLAASSVETNPFYSPWMLGPALRLLPSNGVQVACVFEEEGGPRRLLALAPVAPAKGYARLPFRYVETWMHPHCFFAAPLIRRGTEAEALPALFECMERHPAQPSFLRFRHLDSIGATAQCLRNAAERSGRLAYASGAYERAMLEGGFVTADYVARVIRKKKRKEIARLKNRLADEGGAVFRRLFDRTDLDKWCTDFLALEHAGWKGRQGTSMASSPAEAQFFRETLSGACEAGALEFYRLDKSGAPFAMIVNFVERGEGYSFKIAYDETHARFSPGVMLELEMLKELEGSAGLKFVDSCARPDHSMINSLWSGRRRIAGLNVSVSGVGGRVLLSAVKTLENVSEEIRRRRRPEGASNDI